VVDVAKLLDEQHVSRFQLRVLTLCGLALMLDGFDTQAIGYVAPAVARELQLGPKAMSLVFASGLIGLMIGALVFSPLADRIGRRWVMIACTAFFGLLSVLTTLAWSSTSLTVLRFLTGVGLGGLMPNAISLTAEYCPQRYRATMVMVMFCGFPIGATIGGFLAAPIIPAYGWRAVFLIGGILPLALTPVLIGLLPESIRHLVLQSNKGAQIRKLLERINQRLQFGDDTEFGMHEEQGRGMPVAHLFRQHRAVATVLLWTVFFMSLLDLYLLSSWLPTVFHDAGIRLSLSVIATALFQGGGVVGILTLGRGVDRFGMHRVLSIAYLAGAIFIVLLGRAHSIWIIMLWTFLAGIGIVGGQSAANVVTATYYPTFIRSTGVGWALGIGRLGSIVGPVIGGILLSLKWPLGTIFVAASVPALIASASIFLVGAVRKN
jgi:AAHS family 4-hydroxybenzoate transporter-like MFS transporter